MTFVAYSTNHSRPWMDLVEFGVDEARAKELFDRLEPRMSEEARWARLREILREVRAEMERK